MSDMGGKSLQEMEAEAAARGPSKFLDGAQEILGRVKAESDRWGPVAKEILLGPISDGHSLDHFKNLLNPGKRILDKNGGIDLRLSSEELLSKEAYNFVPSFMRSAKGIGAIRGTVALAGAGLSIQQAVMARRKWKEKKYMSSMFAAGNATLGLHFAFAGSEAGQVLSEKITNKLQGLAVGLQERAAEMQLGSAGIRFAENEAVQMATKHEVAAGLGHTVEEAFRQAGAHLK